jgi:hypothetical protein
MAWFSRLLNKAIALRAIEVTRVSSALSIERFCSPLKSNGSLNLERGSAYPIRMNRIGTCGNPSEINVDDKGYRPGRNRTFAAFGLAA